MVNGDKKEEYSMSLACKRGNIEIVKKLVNLGVDIHERSYYSASFYGHLDIVKYFVGLGYDIRV